MSSTGIVTPAVSLSDLRGTQAAEKLKNTDAGNSAKIQKSAREFEAVLAIALAGASRAVFRLGSGFRPGPRSGSWARTSFTPSPCKR